MDPIANIKEQREIAKDILKTWDDCNADGSLTETQQSFVAEHALRLAELVEALDEWQKKGGFSPYAQGGAK